MYGLGWGKEQQGQQHEGVSLHCVSGSAWQGRGGGERGREGGREERRESWGDSRTCMRSKIS